jgi:pimeloyl-ACP methyl ester carboxylesterase
MQEDFALMGDFTPTQLDQSGITLVAPGLLGSGTWLEKRLAGETRAFTGEKSELDRAIEEAGAEDRHTLVIDAPTPSIAPGGAGRGTGDVADDELLLQVPLARDEAAVVMYIDEAGLLSFHYAQAPAGAAPVLPSRAVGADRQLRFRLQLRTGVSNKPSESRGWIAKLTSKIIKVLVVKVFPDQVGSFVAKRVQAWEQKHRAFEGLHSGTWAQLLDPTPTPVGSLAPYQGHRSLLLIHGTTSTTAGAFSGLARQPELLDRLHAMYGGRVLGFNHHTLSVSVAENLRQFVGALAASRGEYAFDIVCHSRGGLVARALAHLTDEHVSKLTGTGWQRPVGVKVNIGRIVFVATPNAGTVLAEPERIPGFVDRLANYVNMLPDATLTIASGALLSLAGAVAEVALPRLPGLSDQVPGSPLQQMLAPPTGGADCFYAISSDYEPEGDLVSVVKDGVADRIFQSAKNDLVVPSDGVATTPYFALPAERCVTFPPERSVHHSAFFGQQEMVRIADWLKQP